MLDIIIDLHSHLNPFGFAENLWEMELSKYDNWDGAHKQGEVVEAVFCRLLKD